jgi:formylglycine-generating enzyme required for sulfatase activity
LAKSVLAVYIEATADDTEARLLKGLQRKLPDLPSNATLIESLTALRRGRHLEAGQKVLLVLDQFEQWLHAKRTEENTELVQALRQCDGGRVQAIVMVRDDFWLAVSRFLQALEIRLREGENIRLVDLFDPRHARKVLADFGRAFGALPEYELTKDQDAFLDQAIAGLAQDGKVISVRLALFVEMVKGKPWTPATLVEVGGTEGVGVTFLEETFAASTAPPQHRLHQKAAHAVLKALLPEAGTDIKGHMRSQQELLVSSGYAARAMDFDDLLHILDSEMRLITPTDPEGKQDADTSTLSANARYYQLTHDYLVPSLREWLTRKQKETRRGRAELLLADRTAVWNARQENRQLPSLWQWASIRLLTRSKTWTPPQQKMMARAGRLHAVRALVTASVLALAGWAGYESYGTVQAHALRVRLLAADTNEVPAVVADMPFYRPWLDGLLRDAYRDAKMNQEPRKQLHASLALVPVDDGQVAYLYDRLLDAQPHEVPVIRDALLRHRDAMVGKLWAVANAPGKAGHRLRASGALAKYDPQNEAWAKLGPLVARDLVAENPFFLGQWSEAFRDVKTALLPALADIFRDPRPEHAAERAVATNLLADYAAEDPERLAGLLMDADEKQFAVLYPKVHVHAARAVPLFAAALARQPTVVPDKLVFKAEGTTKDTDAKVIAATGAKLLAKRYEVSLVAGRQYRLTMSTSELDAFMVVQDKTGEELAFDDASRGDQYAHIQLTVPRGDTYIVFAAAVHKTGPFELRIVDTTGAGDDKEQLAKRQANAAVALLRLGEPDPVWPLLEHTPDPRLRSYLIHRFAPLGADLAAIIRRIDAEPDVTIRRALILSLGEYGEKGIAAPDREALVAKLKELYRHHTDAGLHAAAEWLLRKWQEEPWLKQINDEWAKNKEERDRQLEAIKKGLAGRGAVGPASPDGWPRWFINGQGQTMVAVPGPVEFLMGSPVTEVGRHLDEPQHRRGICRTFAIAAKPVTVEQFRKFEPGYALPALYSSMPDLPAVKIHWHNAALYCNWLSKQDGIPEAEWCYEVQPTEVKLKAKYLSLRGYRLPSEAEIEYAIRARAVTARYYGETAELLEKYAWYDNNSDEKTWPVGRLKPNDFGLFDALGNVPTWCQDSARRYPQGKALSDDQEDSITAIRTANRVLRGASFFHRASLIRSAQRINLPSFTAYYDNAFRPARTLY